MKATRKSLIAIVIAMLFGSGIFVAASPVVTAQSQNLVNVSVCVQFSDGSSFALKPLYLFNRLGNEVRTGQTDGSGCGTFYSVAANSYYSFVASWDLVWAGQNWQFWGTSPLLRAGDSSRSVYWTWGVFGVDAYRLS